MGLPLQTPFWLRIYGSTLDICLDIWACIANAGIHDSFGIVQLLLTMREKRKYCKVSRKWVETRRWESVCFPLVSQGMLTEEGGVFPVLECAIVLFVSLLDISFHHLSLIIQLHPAIMNAKNQNFGLCSLIFTMGCSL